LKAFLSKNVASFGLTDTDDDSKYFTAYDRILGAMTANQVMNELVCSTVRINLGPQGG